MSLFGARRARQTRVFRPTPNLWDKLITSLQDYRILTRMLVAVLAVILMLCSMQVWQTRFSWREGQVTSSGIQSRIRFQIENAVATQQARADAQAGAPLVFTIDSTVTESIAAAFRADLGLVADAEAIRDVPQEVIESFDLTFEIPGDIEQNIPTQTRFQKIQSTLTDPEVAIGLRVNQMCQEFETLLSGAQPIGILDDEARAASQLSDSAFNALRPVEVVDEEGQSQKFVMSQVTLDDQLRQTGRFGSAWKSLPQLSRMQTAVETWLRQRLKGQLTYSPALTADRRRMAAESVPPQYQEFQAGQVLVDSGTMLGSPELLRLEEEHEAFDASVTFSQRLTSVAGSGLMVLLMVTLIGVYISRNEPGLLDETGHLVALAVMSAGAVLLGTILSQDPWRAEVIPLLAVVMIVAIVHSQVLGVILGFCIALLTVSSTTGSLSHFSVLALLTFVAVIPLKTVATRSALIKLGFVLSAISFLAVWGMAVMATYDFSEAWSHPEILAVGIKHALYVLCCCVLVQGFLPFIEKAFGIVTDISLLELTDVSHPLLQELARRAPGSYNHSITVASIGEAAADSIGANGLLLRVGAYFHDIGKMLKPEYFIENMTEGQENPHDKLSPAMSSLIIIGHVKDGVEMAEQHNLPRKLIDFIEQHHGRTVVEYFYREAANRVDEDHRTDAEEASFQYPGPKPQSRETGVMMLADAIESASRTLKEPTPARIRSLVNEITLKRVMEGQFDECGLTMAELRTVQESIVKSLLAVYHGRVKYPDQKTA